MKHIQYILVSNPPKATGRYMEYEWMEIRVEITKYNSKRVVCY